MSSQPEIFNRNEDEDLDETEEAQHPQFDDDSRTGGMQNYQQQQTHKEYEDEERKSTATLDRISSGNYNRRMQNIQEGARRQQPVADSSENQSRVSAQSKKSQKSKADITIVDLLYRYLELETDIEVKRQQLVAECADFNTIDAFRFLDRNGSGEVTFQDLFQAL